ncbi:hypothetical protein H6G76_00405 [Nostoc sp. FACHB-152]|uniref:hypothetical protein n=1 Tax=unclassified Nostoc TaxID=2593658 RepID=UPI0016877D10|nr:MULTISPECIES: hypothetical protein [unclassified Nostoc]MBD2445633.1 hypothetical protein [Nostoc sp. FACHB-152]MBD2466746.1 hypothetical protein [Nostoc sp. FACHB-145]
MSGFIKVIKNLIAGILGFVTGLLRGKKGNGGYYLQLDESAEPTPAPTPKPAATTNGTKATAKPPEAEKKPAPVEAEKKPAPAAKAVKAKASQNGKVATPEPEKAPTAVAAVKKEPTETTFAPKYLVPSATNGRRRPGANMSSFLDMASQVKTPSQAQ